MLTAAICCETCAFPISANTRVEVTSPGRARPAIRIVLGRFLRDIAQINSEQRNFRVFGPDETLSNGLEAVFEVTNRQWEAATVTNDEFLAPAGRVMDDA